MLRTFQWLPSFVLLLITVPAQAQSAADSAAIRAAALDYIDGWWEGSADRMERAIHPDLAKRIINADMRGRSVLGHQSAMTLVQNTQRGGGRETPSAERRSDVRILDIFGNTASVRVDAGAWVDYMHIAKWNGRWVIINVLWENTPR
ncbi:MAG: nuclear transport factor 2 family protein [Gemmatimonadaceae bacterium]